MGTRSVIGYETEDGGYVGVYCHYDGYTEHMLPQLQEMSYEAVVDEVNRALFENAGARQLRGRVFECFDEDPEPDEWGYFEWPLRSEGAYQEYNYRKRRDGTVEIETWNK